MSIVQCGSFLRALFLLVPIAASFSGFGLALAQEPPKSGAASPKSMSSTKSAESQSSNGFYGNLELRHHVNTYYDKDGYLARSEPSVHSRFQLGLRMYENLLDVFMTLGIYKVPETQQISQRRPEIEIDVYPINSEYVTIQGYSIIQAPFNAKTQSPSDLEAEERSTSVNTSEGTAISLGITPLAKFPIALGSSKVVMKTGVDAWTKLYSRKQYTNYQPDEEERNRLGLAPEDTGEKEIEDYAQHYGSEAMIGMGFWNATLPPLSIDLGAFYDTRFTPKYEMGGDSTEYHYVAERKSHYRFRMQYQWSPRVTLVNDLFQFYDGRFGALENGEDRRFRNIARITCRL